MNTHPQPFGSSAAAASTTTTAAPRSRPTRVLSALRPIHLTSAAWATGLAVYVSGSGMDICQPGYPTRPLLGGLVVALVLQGCALVLACARSVLGRAKAGRGLAGAVVASLLALPAAAFTAFLITFDLCGGSFVL